MPGGTGIPDAGPFRGLAVYDENAAAVFFGRANEIAALTQQVARDGGRATALTGESGVGKTSLLRAGLTPALQRGGVLTLYLGSYSALDQELWQAASRAGAEARTSGESAAEHLVRISRGSRAGTLLILDHLETLVAAPRAAERLAAVGSLLAAVGNAVGPRMRFLLCVEAASFHKLDNFHAVAGFSPLPGAWRELRRLDQAHATEILEQTALQTGTVFEAGLASSIAADLCRDGPCLPADLQLAGRAVVEERLTSVRRYEKSGGAELLLAANFARAVAAAGGRPARRLLLELAADAATASGRGGAGAAAAPAVTSDATLVDNPSGEGGLALKELAARCGLTVARAEQSLVSLAASGLVVKGDGEVVARYALAHPVLAARIENHAAIDALRTQEARRALRRRVVAGERLSLPELVASKRRLPGGLNPAETAVVKKSVHRAALIGGIAAAVALAVLLVLFLDLRSTYNLDFVPRGGAPGARVVVRVGRPSLSFFHFLPASPPLGSVIADTGFAASAMAQDLSRRVADGDATGALLRGKRGAAAPIPAWLRAVVDGLRPVPRGVALVMMGDPNGVVSLKQAFADPASRRQALEALAVIGTGRAGEDEILAAAISDPSPDIRRRAVEVAAAIDRRQDRGSHGATLRAALSDRSFDVRSAVLRESTTLDPATAASILAVALVDKDPSARRVAETALVSLGQRAPGAAAEALRLAVRSPDALARRAALAQLEQIATSSPAEAATALTQIVSDEKAPEEARVAALLHLRRAGVPPNKLQPLLERAVSPEASPRLRAAALPLHVRLLEPAAAEQIALTEAKGPATARAASAAVWGALAAKLPDPAGKALKGFVNDPSAEVRIEAARSLGQLRREGPALLAKALGDPNAEVQRAAIDSAVMLAPAQPGAVAQMLGKALPKARPQARRWMVEALGRIGRERPSLVMPALGKALKEGDSATRATAATTLCGVARRNAGAAAPYLRLAARDDDREVRTAAAACLGGLAEGDPRGAARLAADLASAEEPAVRAAAAASLGTLAPKARELTLAPLVRLAQDPDRSVRVAAAEGIAAHARAHGPLGKRSEEAERALAAVLARGEPSERLVAVRAASLAGLVPVLRQAAADPDEAVRLETVKAAASVEPPALDILQQAVEDRASVVRAEATRRLAAVSGAGAEQVLPIFEAMLRSGDPVVGKAGAAALADLAGASAQAIRLLDAALRQRGEAVRTAAAEALGRIAEREPAQATAILERTLGDPAHDVRMAAVRGLGAVRARRRPPAENAALLEQSERDSHQRLVALEALVLQSRATGETRTQAQAALTRIAASGPPLARLAAQIGRTFRDARPGEMQAFIERLLGG